MGIVRFALRFPHTFYVVAALILFLGVAAIRSMPTDIFPEIRHSRGDGDLAVHRPHARRRWSSASPPTASIPSAPTSTASRTWKRRPSTALSIQKIYFQPDVNLDLAIAQIVSATNSIRALMPPGIQPPIVVQFNASSVPVLQLSLNSDTPERAAAL